MRRREFIEVIAGAIAAWPPAARAQESERRRRIGVLVSAASAEKELRDRIGALHQWLQRSGRADGHKVRIESRAGTGNADRNRKYAEALVALAPEAILLTGAVGVAPVVKATRTVPVV